MTLADGQTAEVDTVIWASGYRDDSEWVTIPGVADERGQFVQEGGISPVPGLNAHRPELAAQPRLGTGDRSRT